MSKYVNHFPQEYKPRNKQIDLLKSIETVFESNKKFCVCCAPTGSGKSLISKTLANLSKNPDPKFVELVNSYDIYRQDRFGEYQFEEDALSYPPFGAFALTITKALQDQYQTLFNSCEVLKGKSNYVCKVDENFDVETGPCVFFSSIRDDCWKQNKCLYYNARNSALTNKFSTLNYKMFLALPAHVKRKNFIICDEASELEDELIKQFTVDIIYNRLKYAEVPFEILQTTKHDKVRGWLTQLSDKLNKSCELYKYKLAEQFKSGMPSQFDREKYIYISNLSNTVNTLVGLWDHCEYIIEKDMEYVTFTPLYARKLTPFIFDYADKILLMSATIIDPANYVRSLGIDYDNYGYVESTSDFDPKKSPIYCSSKNKLNHATINGLLPNIVKQIEKICEKHKDEKGVIHTHTLKITDYIKTHIKDPQKRFIYREGETSNEDILEKHKETPLPTVVVSPSLTHGIDLKDHLARFQIIVKLPYWPLSSERIKKLFDTDKNWYTNKMLNTLVQSCGRATRSQDDYSVTYILDGNIVDVLMREKQKLPKSFLDRIY